VQTILKVDTSPLIVGIDAASIRLGGGITHLKEMLLHFDFESSNIGRVIIWGNQNTLSDLPVSMWIKKIPIDAVDKGLLRRLFWQTVSLTAKARAEGCDILFVPGGSFLGSFKPFVAMSQNLLPFEWMEIRRFWPKPVFFKMILLRIIQAITFRRSQGVIFLSQYSKRKTLTVIGILAAPMAIIPHGLNGAFIKSLKERKEIAFYTSSNPLRVLYVSNIDVYKHQKPVLLAIQYLVAKGYPIKISFMGPGPKNEIDQFIQFQKKLDPKGLWSEYLGQVPYEEIHTYYENADLAVFASSCETFGITLLEKMAAGIPIACSNKSSMPELLKDGGLYFDPEDSFSIANAIEKYLQSPELRLEKQKIAQSLALNYSWEESAQKTFDFLRQVALEYKK